MRFIDPQTDRWQPRGSGGDPARSAHALLSLEQWRAVRAHWPAHVPTGIVLPNTAQVADIADELPRFDLVVLQFPKWTDGRAYSQARLLRTRYRYGGELRAGGDIVADMVPLLLRAGFSTAVLRADQNPAVAHRALSFFDGHYQADATAARPLFGRDAA